MRQTAIQAILFDLDDTLFDHAHSEEYGLQKVYETFSTLHQTPIDYFKTCARDTFEAQWSQVMGGTMTLQQWQIASFKHVCLALAIYEHAPILAACYRKAYQASRKPIEGAVELLQALSEYPVTVGIVTNHLSDEQHAKLAVCGLDHLVDFVLCSDQFPLPKPDKAIFEHALKLAGASADKTVFVGDSWSSDIMGSCAMSMQPFWFNPQYHPLEDSEISQLHALTPISLLIEQLLGLSD